MGKEVRVRKVLKSVTDYLYGPKGTGCCGRERMLIEGFALQWTHTHNP